MTLRFRLTLIVLLIVVFTIPILIIESPLVRSSASMGRLVFADTRKPDNQNTSMVFDFNGNRRRSLQYEISQDDGFLYRIDGEYSYVSLCFSHDYPSCTAFVNQIIPSVDLERFKGIQTFWKANYVSPVWSPDGTHIALNVLQQETLYSVTYTSDVYMMNADGTHIVDLTPNETINVHDVTWSPDSQKIAFACHDAPQYLCLNNVEGSYLQRLEMPTNGAVQDIDWSPSGARLYFHWAMRPLKVRSCIW